MKKKILTILLSSAMIFSMGISTVSAAAADDTAATESTVVSRTDGVTDTTSGKVRGFIDDGTYTFRGIPYAKADRFEMPEAPDSWDGIRNCLVYGSTAPITKMTDPDGGDFIIPHRYWLRARIARILMSGHRIWIPMPKSRLWYGSMVADSTTVPLLKALHMMERISVTLVM